MNLARFFVAALLLQGCTATGQSYDLAHPKATWNLPSALAEVSGISWVDNGHLLAIEDMTPTLYLLNLNSKNVVEKQTAFLKQDAAKFDVEDVALANGTAYVLQSHGELYSVRNWQGKPEAEMLPTGLDRKNNTEGLCFDPKTGRLLVACKNKSGIEDAKKSTRAIYSFDLSKKKMDPQPALVINHKEVEAATGDKAGFYPSAIAVHPQTGNYYILSTRETKGLAVFDRSGKLVRFTSIDAGLMPQPEGLCFAPDGTLFISTESRHGAPARILSFAPGK